MTRTNLTIQFPLWIAEGLESLADKNKTAPEDVVKAIVIAQFGRGADAGPTMTRDEFQQVMDAMLAKDDALMRRLARHDIGAEDTSSNENTHA